MKVCLVAPSLAGGGAESALLETASMLSVAGHMITVVTLEGRESDAYDCPAEFERVAFGLPALSPNKFRGVQNNLEGMRRIRNHVVRCQPDVVISYLTRTNVKCLLALRGLRVCVIVTEHNAPLLDDGSMQSLWRCLRRVVYGRAAHLVVVSHGIAQYYRWLPQSRISVIYNSLREDRTPSPANHPFIKPFTRYVVAMGRLVRAKGFDLLIRAFSMIMSHCPGWDLLILGEGELGPELAGLAHSLGAGDRVQLPGRVMHPCAILERCSLFVLSSRSEGFSNVLVEALSAGLPVISFDCDYGPREIIAHNKSGILVPPEDVDALAGAMRALIADGKTRQRLADTGRASVERFRHTPISQQWLELIARVGPQHTRA